MEAPEALSMVIVSLVLGSVVGSFLNVVIHRLPLGQSLVRPGSRCPRCESPISWYHNVPLIGWLMLRGKCANCGRGISPRYPAVEALTAGSFVLPILLGMSGWRVLLAWGFLAVLISVAFIDLEHQIIPNKIVLPASVVGLAAAVALNPEHWWEFLAGSLGAGAFLMVLALLWPGGMGLGDVKLALFMGAVLGRYVAVALFFGFLLGGLVGVLLIASRLRGRRDRIPFGPFLALGSAVGLFWGEGIMTAYLGMYH